jgi:hypothetical protein
MFELLLAFSMMTGIPDHPQFQEIDRKNIVEANIPLALWLIQNPDTIDYKKPNFTPIGNQDALVQAIMNKGIELQLMDTRETGYFFRHGSVANNDEFEFYMEILRNRYLDLKDAPLEEEGSWRLPLSRHVYEMQRYNRAAYQVLKQRLIWQNYQQDVIKSVISETEELYSYWHLAYEAQSAYSISDRRSALRDLKEKLSKIRDEKDGPSYWDMCKMPPIIPHWRYPDGDSPVGNDYKINP